MAGTAITSVEDALTAARISLDKTTEGTALGNGRCWVLMDTWSREGFEGEQVQVVGCVAIGHHDRLSELTDQILRSLREAGFQPLDFDVIYGDGAAVPGRPIEGGCDKVVVSVPTPYQR